MREFINIIENELVSEVNVINDFDDEINSSRMSLPSNVEALKKATHVAKFNNIDVYRKDEEYGALIQFFFINDQSELIGKATLDQSQNNLHYVRHIWLDPRYRAEGIGYRFYLYLLEDGFELITDTSQTTSSKGVWAKLARKGYVEVLNGPKIIDVEPYYGVRNNARLVAKN